MPWFVKHEIFTAETAALPLEQRRHHLEAHRAWVEQEAKGGRRIRSGFLVDAQRLPGGGGLLIFEAASFTEALEWVQQDPMIQVGLVSWTVQEWIPSAGMAP